MLITRKTRIPQSWCFYAQLTLILSIYAQFVVNAPFILLIKKYLDNPAAIMGLISVQVYVTILGGPLVAWLSDRIWTRFGRRKMFVCAADFLKALFIIAMPFAPNLWVLIILRWAYDFFGDLAAPAQAMINEIVPAKQRGMSAGYMSSFMNIGNLVFFTLLLGRFHDVYFLGPFQFFNTPSGGVLMFLFCGVLFFCASLFEGIGVKETYPPGRKRLMEGRKAGENLFKHFVRTVYKDVLAKDLAPLYLLLTANIMFGFGLGVFQPLLFTEQWGYDLQTFGNTIAIGIPIGIALGLLGGWMADRFGKMRIVFWATLGNLIVNIIYTIYVYNLPDFRPSFWQIVFFGNLAYVFGAVKGVATGPLMWEYIARNRMGAATAGLQIFNTIFRNSIGVFVGFWLLFWSIWFFPQGGYNVTAFFGEELDRAAVMEKAVAAGLDPENVKLRPVHQPGVDRPVSRRWWIHQEDPQADSWIKEREDLQNRLGNLRSRRTGLFVSEERRLEIDREMGEIREQITTLEEQLEARSRALEERLAGILEPVRFRPGEQLRSGSFEGNEIVLEIRTIERLQDENMDLLRGNLRGQEIVMRLVQGEDGISRFEPEVRIESLPQDESGLYAVRVRAQVDRRFLDVFEAARTLGLRSDRAFDLASAFMAVSVTQFTSMRGDFSLEGVEAIPAPSSGGSPALRMVLRPDALNGAEALPVEAVEELFSRFDRRVRRVEVQSREGAYDVQVFLEDIPMEAEGRLRFAEVRPRLAEELGAEDARLDFSMVFFRKVADTLASRPIFVTVPRHTVDSGYTKRIYEYFFSSQLLQIFTDVFGLGILLMIMYLEKRGTLHRYGAEEDDNR